MEPGDHRLIGFFPPSLEPTQNKEEHEEKEEEPDNGHRDTDFHGSGKAFRGSGSAAGIRGTGAR
jgi:hypothetical protein